MLKKNVPLTLLCLLASVLVFFGSGYAVVAAQGAGPESALTPSGDWTPLAVGGRVWYAFDYTGDGSPVLIRMGVEPSGSATFSVWTPEDLAAWASDGIEDPVGRGSANDAFGGDLIWAGSFNTAGTYYVLVEQTGLDASYYQLTIN